MTWTAEQERAHRAARSKQAEAVRAVQRGFEVAKLSLTHEQAADIILHADSLIALLQPFASEPEPAVVPPQLEAAFASCGGADAEGWIENTGTCPIAGNVHVDVLFKHGGVDASEEAGTWSWHLDGNDWVITHWRLHKPQESRA
jgi:hypothetical protein